MGGGGLVVRALLARRRRALLPFFFAEGVAAVVGSLVASAAGLFLIGVAITLLTGRRAAFSGMRQDPTHTMVCVTGRLMS